MSKARTYDMTFTTVDDRLVNVTYTYYHGSTSGGGDDPDEAIVETILDENGLPVELTSLEEERLYEKIYNDQADVDASEYEDDMDARRKEQ